MAAEIPSGFIHLLDLINIQQRDRIFTVPENESDDILENMRQQEERDKGVAFDLRLGRQYYLSGDDMPRKLPDGGYLKIQPGQFALLTIYEIFHMPRELVAFISMRFTIKSQGLINVSGFQVDPGYNGLFIFSVYNAGPKEVRLRYKNTIFTVLFSRTSRPVREMKNGYSDIPLTMWDLLVGPKKISLIGLDERVGKIEGGIRLVKYLIPTIIASVGVIIALLGLK